MLWDRLVNATTVLEECLVVFQRVEHRATPRAQHFQAVYIPKKNENLCLE